MKLASAAVLALAVCAPRHQAQPAPAMPYSYAPVAYGQPPAPYPGPAQVAPPVEAPPSHGPDHPGQRSGAPPKERGKASYYHDSLAGNATASGERYDPALLTAAHKSLPFGSVVDVVRADGRWVRVRVNDRGPFKRGRVIDLSRRAAELVGLVEPGVADVALYLVPNQ